MLSDWETLWTEAPERFNAWPSEELVRWASTLEPGLKVLEVGCGQGGNLGALLSFDLDPWGVDVAQDAVERCAWLLGPSQVKVGSAVELTFDSGSFDAVADVQCLQHLASTDQATAYAEIARVLKPGGRFFSLYLVTGQEHFPELNFSPLNLGLSTSAGLACRDLGLSYRRSHGRSYSYVVLECERV